MCVCVYVCVREFGWVGRDVFGRRRAVGEGGGTLPLARDTRRERLRYGEGETIVGRTGHSRSELTRLHRHTCEHVQAYAAHERGAFFADHLGFEAARGAWAGGGQEMMG